MENIKKKQKKTSFWFKKLRDEICKELELLEKKYANENHLFQRKLWKRMPKEKKSHGGGEISVMRGKIFEKAGVNISTVYGSFSQEFRGKIPGTENNPSFWASGISVVIHPKSPLIPSVHMNTRHIVTSKSWFGGGADITPSHKYSNESVRIAKLFHKEFKTVCDSYEKGSYKKYKKWCDKYFYLPHRNESRGLGGIFYDYLESDSWEKDFTFTKNVGLTFLNTYKTIVDITANKKWTDSDLKAQLLRRSRYTEFNLLYDRGTKFGLKTDGNPDAILMSLPPSVSW